MEKDPVAQDRNIIGRIGAVVVIAAAVFALGRICGMDSGMCPIGRMCPFLSAHGLTETGAAPAAEAPADSAAPVVTPAPPAAPAEPLKQ